MGLLDLFTGDASNRAARNNASAIAAGQTLGDNALTSGASNALQYLLGGPGSAGALQVQDRGFDQAGQALGTQYGQTQNALTSLGQLYQPLVDQGQGAETRYLNATGANGAAGSAQAQQDFTAAPGYQYSLNQALGSVQRSAASRGGLAGGNATSDILNTASGLANQGYQQYVNNLGNASSIYGQGIAGQAGALQGQATASQGYGNALSALDTGHGAADAGVLGSAAGVQTGLGQGLANLSGQATSALTQNNNNLAQSQNAAGANILSGILGLAGLGVGGAGSNAGAADGATGSGRSSGGTLGGNAFAALGRGFSSLL